MRSHLAVSFAGVFSAMRTCVPRTHPWYPSRAGAKGRMCVTDRGFEAKRAVELSVTQEYLATPVTSHPCCPAVSRQVPRLGNITQLDEWRTKAQRDSFSGAVE